MTPKIPFLLRSILLFLAVCFSAFAETSKLPSAAKGSVDFVRDIEPILHTRCYECHGPGMQMNGLRFDQKDSVFKGGYSGPVLLPGKGGQSPLILRVSSSKDNFKMPPNGPALSSGEIGLLRVWIDQGAVGPETPAPAPRKLSESERRSHWAFQAVKRPFEPAIRQKAWIRNPIDS